MTRQTSTYPVSAHRIFFCLLILAACSVVPARSFQARSIEVVPSGGTRVEALPGKLLTLSFKVTNTTSARKRFESSVTVPTGWRRLAKDFPFELEGRASDIRLLSISIPAEAPAGEYPLRYTIKDPANPSDVTDVLMTIAITAVKEQALKLLESPRLAIAGEPYSSAFLLNNKGNITSEVHLTARTSSKFVAALDSAVIHLKPGESRTIVVKVSTDPAITSKAQDVLELVAELDEKNSVTASSYVEVIPRITGVEERYVRFPVLSRIRFTGEQGKRGTQVEFVGSGPLGNDQDSRLDLLVRTPDIQQKSILGQRDEYQLGYSTKSYDLFLGDKNYGLSPLTEYNRYGFGASAHAKIQKFGLGGFYNETRFFTPALREWAGYLNYQVVDGAQVGINYLGKQDQNLSNTVTLRSLSEPFKASEVELEYGISSMSNKRDDAYSARWTGRGEVVSYDMRYIRAGTNYAGYYKDLELKNIDVGLAPMRDIRIEGYYRDEQRNLNLDTTLRLAPRDQYYQIGVSISSILAVYYRTNDQNDQLPHPQYRRREETWQFRTGLNLTSFTLMANADIGSTEDKLAGVKNPFQRYSTYLSIQPLEGQSFGFSAEYTKGRDALTLESQEQLGGSFNLNLSLGVATQFAFGLFGTRSWGASQQTYSLLDVSLEHAFPWGHAVTLRGRQSIFSPSFETKERAWLAEYTIPIGVPIARSTVSGQLVGRVVDSEKGTGLQNVLVYAGGATALTDRKGEYYFPALKPDKYFVQIDLASVGVNRVVMQQMPHEVTITGGQESRFDMSLNRSVSVSGTVLMFVAKEQAANDTTPPAIVEQGGHPNVVMELSSGEEINRRVTDNRGRFTFSNIRPGRWTLRIVDGNLPQGYYFDRDSYELTLAPAQTSEQSFKALPRRRRIQMIQQGVTISAAGEKGKATPTIPEKKVVAPPQPKTKPVETAIPKKNIIEPVPQKEIKKPMTATVQPSIRPEQVPCVVVFWPEKLIFGIHHSDWHAKLSADSMAEVLSKKSSLHVFVEPVLSNEGKVSYRILIGAFKSRVAAQNACEAVRGLR